jgi:hypothetical protein
MIATNCFSYKECQNLANLLFHRFNLRTSVISAGVPNQWNISIWKQSLPIIRSMFIN